MSGGEYYDDGQAREMAKFAHDRNARAQREHEAAMRIDLADIIHDGYYEEYDETG